MYKKIQDACTEIGVTRQTLYNWKKKGVLTFVKSPTGGTFIEVDDSYLKIKEFYDRTERIDGTTEL